MKVSAESLTTIKIFSILDYDKRSEIASCMNATEYAPKQLIISHEDTGTDVFFVISGLVRATLYSTNGKEVTFQDLGPGEMFGELAAIDAKPRSTHVISKKMSVIASLDKELFIDIITSDRNVMLVALNRLTSLVRMHCDRIFEFSTLGVNNRIHSELLRLAREQSSDLNSVSISNPPTHAEIASRVSSHREAVTRECKRLESIGLIEWHPGKHEIKDIKELERMVKEVRG